jgi:hypothetical protein
MCTSYTQRDTSDTVSHEIMVDLGTLYAQQRKLRMGSNQHGY